MKLTNHALKRCRQCSIPKNVVRLIYEHGDFQNFCEGRVVLSFTRDHFIAEKQRLEEQIDMLLKAVGHSIVIEDKFVITVY